MKSERLMDLISEIDPELIESADIKPAKKRVITPLIVSLTASVACIALIFSVIFIAMHPKKENHTPLKQNISAEPITTNIASYISDEPIKKVDIDISQINTYGCNAKILVNNKADYDKYYTYGEYKIYKKTENGDELLTPVPTVEIHTIVPADDGKQNFKTEIKSVPLSEKETDIDILWANEYGLLEEGDYYISIIVYDTEDGEPKAMTIEKEFTIEK